MRSKSKDGEIFDKNQMRVKKDKKKVETDKTGARSGNKNNFGHAKDSSIEKTQNEVEISVNEEGSEDDKGRKEITTKAEVHATETIPILDGDEGVLTDATYTIEKRDNEILAKAVERECRRNLKF